MYIFTAKWVKKQKIIKNESDLRREDENIVFLRSMIANVRCGGVTVGIAVLKLCESYSRCFYIESFAKN